MFALDRLVVTIGSLLPYLGTDANMWKFAMLYTLYLGVKQPVSRTKFM